MSYFKIGAADFSQFVSSLKVKTTANYNAQTNAAGNTVVDYINSKRSVEVGIIPLDSTDMLNLKAAIKAFTVSLSFLDPDTNALAENVSCIIPENEINFYTVQVNKVKYQAATLNFIEL